MSDALTHLGLPTIDPAIIDDVVCLLVFVPFGALVALLLGPQRWGRAIVVVGLASCWLELAQAVWVPVRNPSLMCAAAQVVGGAIGLVIVALAIRTGARGQRVRRESAGFDGLVESSTPRP